MQPIKIFTIASESEMKEQGFLVCETQITHRGDMLIASAIEVKLVEKEAYVFTKDELVGLLRDAVCETAPYSRKTQIDFNNFLISQNLLTERP